MTKAKPRGAARADTKKTFTDRDLFASKGEESMGTRFLFRLTALAVAMAMVVLGAGVAWADQVSGDADSDAVASPHSNSVTANQAEGTTASYSLSALIKETGNSGDDVFRSGQSDSVTVTITRSGSWVDSTNPGANFASSFTAYNVSQSGSIGITVPACTAVGTVRTMTVDLSGSASNGRSLSAATLTYTITSTAGSSSCTPADTTAPTGTVSINSGASYTNSSAATLNLSATDNVGVTQFRKAQVADCSTLTSTDSSWSTWTAYATSVSHNLGSEDGSKTVCVQFKDAAANASATASDSIVLDTTAPSVTDAGPTTQPNAAGWYKTQVTNTFTASDSGSGLADCSASFTKSSGTNEGTAIKVASGTCTDAAGNVASSIDSAGFKIDLTAPGNFQFSADPQSHYFGETPATLPTCTADDALSLLTAAGCTVSPYATPVGTHRLTATATDNAGNTGTAYSATYSVLSWTLRGFYSPVDMNNVTNVVKPGSTVPLKFEVFAGTRELTDTAAVNTFTVTRRSCSEANGATDSIENYSTGGTSLRYDSTVGQFIQNWKVPTGSNTCYEVELTTDDGSDAIAFFKTK